MLNPLRLKSSFKAGKPKMRDLDDRRTPYPALPGLTPTLALAQKSLYSVIGNKPLRWMNAAQKRFHHCTIFWMREGQCAETQPQFRGQEFGVC